MVNRIDVNKVFSTDEVALMSEFVRAYAAESHSPQTPARSITEVLDTEWAVEKYPFYKAFGEKLILSKHITYSTEKSELREKFYNEMCSWRETPMSEFYRTVIEIANSAPSERFTDDDGWRYANVFDAIKRNLFDLDYIVDNVYNGPELTIPTPEGSTIKVQQGSKTIKMIGKIAKAFDIEGFENFRLEHSRILNTSRLEGDLCVSIHPLDYMTMSENDNNWQSCMNWANRGCYRRGTVEMMNSPMVVVAYLTSSTPMQRFGKEWNNKKWRQLFVIVDEAIVGVKSYPYNSDTLMKISIEWLAEIMNAADPACNYDMSNYQTYNYEDGSFYGETEDKTLPLEFNTNAMYNDFGCEVYHGICASKPYFAKPRRREYNYSGASQCMFCGEIICSNYDDSDSPDWTPAESLICGKCGGPDTRCPECGAFCNHKDFMSIDGREVCSYCYYNRSSEDCFTHERHLNSTMHSIRLVNETFHPVMWGDYYHSGIMFHDPAVVNSEAWYAAGLPTIIVKEINEWFRPHTEYYVRYKDLPLELQKKAIEYIGYNTYEEYDEAMIRNAKRYYGICE
jgi:hypothetical protein